MCDYEGCAENVLRTKISVSSFSTEGETRQDANPRFSTTSSTDDEVFHVDQLVVAQVHHHPIFESQLESETDDAETDDLGKLGRFVAAVAGASTLNYRPVLSVLDYNILLQCLLDSHYDLYEKQS